MMGNSNTIFPALLFDDNFSVLIDTGYPGQLPLLQQAIAKVGSSLSSIEKIILTHQDIDHIGNVSSLLNMSSHPIEVIAPLLEQPYIQGEKTLQKHTPEAIATAVKNLPSDVPSQWKQAFRHTLENPPTAKVNKTVVGGDELPFLGGIIVIDTPGHTIGHTSYYHKTSKTLIAGDALTVENNELVISSPLLTFDMEKAIESIGHLTHYDIETVLCYHGGIFDQDVNACMLELYRCQKNKLL
nr:MBL fold metallo-hydrolase [Shimazuella soli]